MTCLEMLVSNHLVKLKHVNSFSWRGMLQLPELLPASVQNELRMTSGYICLLFICEKCREE